MTQDKRNKTQDGKAHDSTAQGGKTRSKLRRTPHGAWHGTLAWLGLLLAGPAQACTCASPAPTVDDLLQAADAVAEVRVTREYELKYLILQARCEADASCRDALTRLDAGPAAHPLHVLRQARLGHSNWPSARAACARPNPPWSLTATTCCPCGNAPCVAKR